MAIKFSRTIPTLRMFDEHKAKEFYGDYLGFRIDWEHRFEPHTPLYMQVSRDNIILHLSEHHGDGVPGTVTRVDMTGIDEFLSELRRKKYKYYRPSIQLQPWNARELSVIDPFGNHIRFSEAVKSKESLPSQAKKRRSGR